MIKPGTYYLTKWGGLLTYEQLFGMLLGAASLSYTVSKETGATAFYMPKPSFLITAKVIVKSKQ